MNKIIIGVTVLVALAIGWFILNPGDTFDYVVNIDQEVTQLENELAELDIAVEAGTLTPEQATAAKVRIITRLDSINAAATASEATKLTVEQRTQLANGLLRLKDALVSYQATLNAVEDMAVEADVAAQLNTGNGRSSTHISLIVAETIADVEETVVDSVQDYEANAELDAQVDFIVEETETEEAIEDAVEEGQNMDESGTSTEDSETTEDGAEMEMPTMDDDSAGEMEISSETDITVDPAEEITQ